MMSKFLSIETTETITLNEEFYKEVNEAYNNDEYGKIIKLIVDLYIFINNNTKNTMPDAIYLNDFRYVTKDGYHKEFEGCCRILLSERCADYLETDKLYKYRGFICRFEVKYDWSSEHYYEPKLVIICKEEDIENLDEAEGGNNA